MDKYEFTAHVRAAALKSDYKAMLFVIADRYHWSKEGPVWASQENLGLEAGMSRGRANDVIKELKEWGWLRVAGRSRYMTEQLVPVVPEYKSVVLKTAKKVVSSSDSLCPPDTTTDGTLCPADTTTDEDLCPADTGVVSSRHKHLCPPDTGVVSSRHTNKEENQEVLLEENQEDDAAAPPVQSQSETEDTDLPLVVTPPVSPLPPKTTGRVGTTPLEEKVAEIRDRGSKIEAELLAAENPEGARILFDHPAWRTDRTNYREFREGFDRAKAAAIHSHRVDEILEALEGPTSNTPSKDTNGIIESVTEAHSPWNEDSYNTDEEAVW